jgi:type I restriction enzyme S subunit
MPWPTKKLGELISKYFSGTWGEDPKGDSNARVIRVSDIKPDLSINYKNVPIRRLKEKDLEKYRLQIGDIVVVKSSGNQTKIISGRAALFEYKGKDVYVPSNFLIALRPNRNLIIPMWLWVNLNSKAAKRFIELIIGATTYPNLKPAEYLNLKIPVPPLSIQQKIVERLDVIKKAQELNDKQIELAEELFQSLLNKELYLEKRKWDIKKLKEVCIEITDGTHHTPKYINKGIPFLSVKNIKEDRLDFTDIQYISEEEHNQLIKRCNPQKGDVLYTKVGTTGIAKAIDVDKKFSIFVSVALLRVDKKKIIPEFLEKVLNSPFCRRQAYLYTQGAANQNLVIRDIERIKIPLPPLETQQKIVEKLSAVQEYKKKLLDQKQKLQELFESVLNKSFKGELVG